MVQFCDRKVQANFEGLAQSCKPCVALTLCFWATSNISKQEGLHPSHASTSRHAIGLLSLSTSKCSQVLMYRVFKSSLCSAGHHLDAQGGVVSSLALAREVGLRVRAPVLLDGHIVRAGSCCIVVKVPQPDNLGHTPVSPPSRWNSPPGIRWVAGCKGGGNKTSFHGLHG